MLSLPVEPPNASMLWVIVRPASTRRAASVRAPEQVAPEPSCTTLRAFPSALLWVSLTVPPWIVVVARYVLLPARTTMKLGSVGDVTLKLNEFDTAVPPSVKSPLMTPLRVRLDAFGPTAPIALKVSKL